jgi:transcriptional regulator with XRE-family HTH domain
MINDNKPHEDDLLIGDKIFQFRNALHLTQDGLAKQSKMSQSHFSDIEAGRRSATITELNRIAQSLNKQVKELMPAHYFTGHQINITNNESSTNYNGTITFQMPVQDIVAVLTAVVNKDK